MDGIELDARQQIAETEDANATSARHPSRGAYVDASPLLSARFHLWPTKCSCHRIPGRSGGSRDGEGAKDMNPKEILNTQGSQAGQASNEQNVRALLVSPFEDDSFAFRQIFRQYDWDLEEAHSYGEALEFFTKDRVPIVIYNPASAQRGWQDLVSHLAPVPQPPRMFIISETADQALATEVSEQAGGDVLSKPFKDEDVARRIRSAWLVWRQKSRIGTGESDPSYAGHGRAVGSR
jgi:hypothetical protein